MNTAKRIVNWQKWKDFQACKYFGEDICIVDAIRLDKELEACKMANETWSDAERYRALRELAYINENRQELIFRKIGDITDQKSEDKFDEWCDKLIVALLPPYNARLLEDI